MVDFLARFLRFLTVGLRTGAILGFAVFSVTAMTVFVLYADQGSDSLEGLDLVCFFVVIYGFAATVIGAIYGALMYLLHFVLYLVATFLKVTLYRWDKTFARICVLISSVVTLVLLLTVVRNGFEVDLSPVYVSVVMVLTAIVFAVNVRQVAGLVDA